MQTPQHIPSLGKTGICLIFGQNSRIDTSLTGINHQVLKLDKNVPFLMQKSKREFYPVKPTLGSSVGPVNKESTHHQQITVTFFLKGY